MLKTPGFLDKLYSKTEIHARCSSITASELKIFVMSRRTSEGLHAGLCDSANLYCQSIQNFTCEL